MPDIPPVPAEITEDLAMVLSPAERIAVRDARLIVYLVRTGDPDTACELAAPDNPAHFFGALEELCDRIEEAERVGNRKMREWIDAIRKDKP